MTSFTSKPIMNKLGVPFGIGALLLSATALPAADTTVLFDDFSSGGPVVPSLTIPDGSPAGISDTRLLSGIGIPVLGSVAVGLEISGAVIGDLYAYLRYENGPEEAFSVLLNRPGRSAANTLGGINAGLDLVLRDNATDNVHDYLLVGGAPAPSSPLTGDWQPDGREIDPGSSGATFDASLPSTPLSGFNGYGADGQWTLFVGDLSGGAEHQLESWSLTFTPIPEPEHVAVLAGLACGLLALRRWRQRR
jgi:subtilisin-like proprotein convertase family protein